MCVFSNLENARDGIAIPEWIYRDGSFCNVSYLACARINGEIKFAEWEAEKEELPEFSKEIHDYLKHLTNDQICLFWKRFYDNVDKVKAPKTLANGPIAPVLGTQLQLF